MPKIMARFGNYRTVSSLIILAAFLLLGLSILRFYLSCPDFVAYLSIIPLIIVCLDVFLEKFSDNEKPARSAEAICLSPTPLGLSPLFWAALS